MRYVVHVDASTLYSLQMCRGSVWSLPYLGLSKVPITGTIGSDDKMALNKAIFILDPHNTSISVSRILGLAYVWYWGSSVPVSTYVEVSSNLIFFLLRTSSYHH